MNTIETPQNHIAETTPPPVVEPVAATVEVAEVIVPPLRKKRKIFLPSVILLTACALGYWNFPSLKWLFFEAILPYAQPIGTALLAILVMRFKDWRSYQTHKVRIAIMALVIVFTGLTIYNQAHERQDKEKSAETIGALRKEIRDLRDETHISTTRTTQSLDALKTETDTHGNALEKLGKQQLQISQQDVALKYEVSVDVVYSDKKFQIFNKGKSNISLWGTKLGDGPRTFDKQPRLISPGSNYYLVADQWEREMLARLKENDETRGPLQLYLKDDLKREIVLDCLLWVVTKNGDITVHTQNVGVETKPWPK